MVRKELSSLEGNVLEHEQISNRYFYSTEIKEVYTTGISCKMDGRDCSSCHFPDLNNKVPEAVSVHPSR